MAKVDAISNVGIFVTNQKRARDFYTKKLGLKVVGGMPEWGYLELAVRKGGKDAVLNLWTPKAWGLSAKEAKKKVGVTTGIGLGVDNFEGTVASLKKKGVKVDVWHGEGYHMATVHDPDGNGLFLAAETKKSKKKPGITRLDWVTISSRNAKRSGAFFQKTLGMKKAGGDEWAAYSASPGGTALMPFTPKKSNYENASDYKADLAAIGEDTAIMLRTSDAKGLEKQLKKKGVKFESPMEEQDWGGVSANIFDPDGNKYMLFQPRKR